MSKIKLLINEVFKQGERDSGLKKKYPLSLYLKVHLETFKLYIDEKTFVRYYEAYVLGTNKEMDPDPDTLNKLSQYVGFKDFADFSRTFVKKDENANKTTVKISVDEDEESLTEKLSKIIINITNEQHFKMPEFIKQNGFGIVELTFIMLLLTGNVVFSNNKNNSFGIMSNAGSWTDKKYMYWNGEIYIPTDSSDVGPEFNVVAIDFYKVKHFKRITRKDTLTEENATGKTWYSKYNGEVEFFTADGVDPDTDRELRKSTSLIVNKYAGPQADSLQTE
ncbi:hypothetical protein SAMN05421664_1697 [Chryseobacterium soldanellicola]|uniref:Uncharacterized protein n=1 Tax=Chryseobacterium soldanellicola TaxID=311333 RepID=A0A1H1B327_9FLAO|nr:hypothetical protein [Chryseobacterium soldanellicola]SDQ46339.1 hypothetical protein SAMN05421664_1697 [Chryseobacterium soldanellicola]